MHDDSTYLIKVNLVHREAQLTPARLEILTGESDRKLIIWEFFWPTLPTSEAKYIVQSCADNYPHRGIFHVSEEFVSCAMVTHQHTLDSIN